MADDAAPCAVGDAVGAVRAARAARAVGVGVVRAVDVGGVDAVDSTAGDIRGAARDDHDTRDTKGGHMLHDDHEPVVVVVVDKSVHRYERVAVLADIRSETSAEPPR